MSEKKPVSFAAYSKGIVAALLVGVSSALAQQPGSPAAAQAAAAAAAAAQANANASPNAAPLTTTVAPPQTTTEETSGKLLSLPVPEKCAESKSRFHNFFCQVYMVGCNDLCDRERPTDFCPYLATFHSADLF